jgi:cell division ATPase FtsA
MPAENEKKIKNKIELKKVIKLDKKQPANAGKGILPDDVIFSLDIGTRTIVGIAGVQEGEKFKVIAAESLEHRSRAMLDGQIHDIDQVAQLASEVKARIEKTIGFELSKVRLPLLEGCSGQSKSNSKKILSREKKLTRSS